MRRGHRVGGAALLLAGLFLVALAAGCSRSWNQQEHAAVVEMLERMNAASKPPPPQAGAAPAAPAATGRPAPVAGDVRLTLTEAIRLALAHNPDIQIAGYLPTAAEADLVTARAVYDPAVFLSNTLGRNDRPIQSTLDTGQATRGSLIEDTWAFRGGLKQHTATGGNAAIYQELNYLDSNSVFVLPNPQYTSRLNFEWQQPLLKGLGDTDNQAAIKIANLAAGVTLQDFRLKVIEIASRVAAAYWQLAFEREASRIARDNRDMAREVLRREKVRADRGLSNDMNTARASAAASLREADVVRAENRARIASDALKALLSAPELPVQGEAVLIPADPPRFFLVDVNRTAAMTTALARRPELDRARAALEAGGIRVDAATRNLLPKLDATLRYTLNGLGNDMGASMEMQQFNGPFTWVAGLEFEVPLGNRAAQADQWKRRAEVDQSRLQIDALTDQILQEVSAAVRTIFQGRDEVEITEAAVASARKLVKAENVRYELGDVSNDELLRAQDTLTLAEREHLQALVTFNLALVDLARTRGTLVEDRGVEIVWPEDPRDRPRPLAAALPENKNKADVPALPLPEKPKAPKTAPQTKE